MRSGRGVGVGSGAGAYAVDACARAHDGHLCAPVCRFGIPCVNDEKHQKLQLPMMILTKDTGRTCDTRAHGSILALMPA